MYIHHLLHDSHYTMSFFSLNHTTIHMYFCHSIYVRLPCFPILSLICIISDISDISNFVSDMHYYKMNFLRHIVHTNLTVFRNLSHCMVDGSHEIKIWANSIAKHTWHFQGRSNIGHAAV